jgi:hypothetical protein
VLDDSHSFQGNCSSHTMKQIVHLSACLFSERERERERENVYWQSYIVAL